MIKYCKCNILLKKVLQYCKSCNKQYFANTLVPTRENFYYNYCISESSVRATLSEKLAQTFFTSYSLFDACLLFSWNQRLTARNVDRLLITSSTFLTIPWPGFYVYNATKVTLKQNFFKAVAAR